MLRAFIEDWQPPSATRATPGRFVARPPGRARPSASAPSASRRAGSSTRRRAARPLGPLAPLYGGLRRRMDGHRRRRRKPDRPAPRRRPVALFRHRALGGAWRSSATPRQLRLASDRPHAQLAVRLCDVAPDGPRAGQLRGAEPVAPRGLQARAPGAGRGARASRSRCAGTVFRPATACAWPSPPPIGRWSGPRATPPP